MNWFKIRFIYILLTVLNVGADHLVEDLNSELSTSTSMTALPIVLQLSTTLSSIDLKPPTMMMEASSEKNHAMHNHHNANNIEVFDYKVVPKMAKQEEEEAEVEAGAGADAEAEPEEEVAAEEAKPEEAENKKEEEEEVKPEPTSDDKVEPEEIPKEEETSGNEIEPKPETEAEAPAEENGEIISETEAETPNEEPAVDAEVTASNTDSDMQNDEPSKDDEKNKDETTPDTPPGVHDKNEISCFTCTSNNDLKCHKSPSQQNPCPKGNDSKKEKQHGCYTLYETDTNITMRGCVDELAEEGLKYCLTNEKFCKLCYQTGCNNKTAPSLGNMQQLNIFLLLITMIFMVIKDSI